MAANTPIPHTTKLAWRRAAIVAVWIWFAVVIAVTLLLWGPADAWSIGALISYGPRWPWIAILLLMAPIALAAGRSAIVPFAVAALLTMGPVANFCVPWQRLMPRETTQLRLVACNVQGQKDMDVFRRLLQLQPDVLALQECYGAHIEPALPEDWYLQKLEGLVLASRFPIQITDVVRDRFPTGAVLYSLDVDGRDVFLINLQMPSPQFGLRSLLENNLASANWGHFRSEQLRAAKAARHLADRTSGPLILAGDFNTTTNCWGYRRCWSDFANAFGRAGLGVGSTKRTPYQGFSVGSRIDHILTRGGWRCHQSWVSEDVGSDHLPLVADLSIDLTGRTSELIGERPCVPQVGELTPEVVQSVISMVVPRPRTSRITNESQPGADQGDATSPFEIQVFSRYLQDDIDDFFTNLRASHLQHLPKNIGQQSLTFTQDEAEELARVVIGDFGSWQRLPSSLATKILRQAMVDTTADRRPIAWSEEEIRCHRLSVRGINASKDAVTVEISGEALLTTDIHSLRAERGFALRLYGKISVDTADRKFQRVELLGLGEYWNGVTRIRGTGDGRPVLAIALKK